MTSLTEKRALVTGGSRGIGRAIAVELARRGARVVINFRDNESAALETVDLALEAGAPEAFAVRAHVGEAQDAANLAEQALGRLGGIDILVNNAGIQRPAMLHRMSVEDWREVLATNLDSVFYLSRALLPVMRAQGSGHIVNIASASSYVARPGVASYIASKHALIGLTKAMALENAPKNVLVNAVAPGLTETSMLDGIDEQARAGLLSLVPLGRMGDPQEVANMVAWLVSEVQYSTGNVFHISGGVVMG